MENIILTPVPEDNGAANYGQDFENKLRLLLALIATVNYKKFTIKINDVEFAPLNDITLQVKDKVYLIQSKHVAEATKLKDDLFIAGHETNENKFDLKACSEEFKKLKNSSCDKKLVFIFYTNYSRNIKSKLFKKNKQGSHKFFEMLNTNENSSIFVLNQSCKEVKQLDQNFLNNSYFFLNQTNNDDFTKVLKKILLKLQFDEDLSHVILDNLLGFFKNFWTNSNGGLTKKLAQHFLYFSYLYTRSIDLSNLNLSNMVNDKPYESDLWKCLISDNVIIKSKYLKKVKCTIFKREQCIDSYPHWSSDLNLKDKNSIIANGVIKEYFYDCCMGFYPFLIDAKFYFEANQVLKNIKSFKILFFADDNLYKISRLPAAINFSKNEFFNVPPKIILQNVNVSDILETYENSVEEIDDKRERFIYKLKVDKRYFDILSQLNDDLVIILNCKCSILHLRTHHQLWSIDADLIKFKHELEEGINYFSENLKIIISKTKKYFNHPSLKFKNIHGLNYENNNFYWRGTIGSTENLIFHEVDDQKTLEITKFCDYFVYGNLFIFSGVPGIGNTVAMKQLKKYFNQNNYSLLVNLKDKQDLLKSFENIELDCLTMLCLLENDQNSLNLTVIKYKFKLKKVIVIFDDYDKIVPTFASIIHKIINCILQKGIKVVIKTTVFLENQIEGEFSTKPLMVVPFNTKHEQKYCSILS